MRKDGDMKLVGKFTFTYEISSTWHSKTQDRGLADCN